MKQEYKQWNCKAYTGTDQKYSRKGTITKGYSVWE